MPDIDSKAAEVADELEQVLEEARRDVAASALEEEEKRQQESRIEALERRLMELESRSTTAAVVGEGGTQLEDLEEAIEELADKVAAPATPVADPVLEAVDDVAEPVETPVEEVVDDVEDAVEEVLPKRKHSLFKRLPFSSRKDD